MFPDVRIRVNSIRIHDPVYKYLLGTAGAVPVPGAGEDGGDQHRYRGLLTPQEPTNPTCVEVMKIKRQFLVAWFFHYMVNHSECAAKTN